MDSVGVARGPAGLVPGLPAAVTLMYPCLYTAACPGTAVSVGWNWQCGSTPGSCRLTVGIQPKGLLRILSCINDPVLIT